MSQTNIQHKTEMMEIINFYVRPLFSFISMITLLVRYNQIRQLSKIKDYPLNLTFKIRIFVIQFGAILQLILLIISIISEEIWVSQIKSNIKFTIILIVIVDILQIFILRREYKLNIPFIWYHRAYWTIQLVLVVIQDIFILKSNKRFKLCDYIYLFEFCYVFFLFAYSIIKPQDIKRFQDLNCFLQFDPRNNEDLQMIDRQKVSFEESNYLFYFFIIQDFYSQNWKDEDKNKSIFFQIIVDKNLKIKQLDGETIIYIKLKVLNNKFQIISEFTHPFIEFIQLQQNIKYDLINKLISNYQELVDNMDILSEKNNICLTISQKVNQIQQFFDIITSKLEYHTESLIEFLKIDPELQQKIYIEYENYVLNQSNPSQSFEINQHYRQSSQLLEMGFLKMGIMKNLQHYCKYIMIIVLDYQKIDNHYCFNIKFKQIGNKGKSWIMVKRYNQFHELSENILKEKKIRLPLLPKKVLILDDKDLEQRGIGLQNFLNIIYNEDIYHCQALNDFADVKNKDQENLVKIVRQLYNENFFKTQYQSIQKGSTLSLDSSGRTYTVYHFEIRKLDIQSQQFQYFNQINKRYNDFEDLHKQIELIFYNKKINSSKLPETPAKFSLNDIKTSISTREKLFNNYINNMFEINDILDSYSFRQFIQINFNIDDYGRDMIESMKLEGRSNRDSIDNIPSDILIKQREERFGSFEINNLSEQYRQINSMQGTINMSDYE